MNTEGVTAESLDDLKAAFQAVRAEILKVIVGQSQAVDELLVCLFAGGHALVEAVPGLGKTLLVKTLSECLGMTFARIQCTPDLMPSDIIGTNVLYEADGQKLLRFEPGPVFANTVLVDEINRATPKTQSALLESMQELRVTVGKTTYELERPFVVIATQNPIELAGTYPLPEAQIDRFLLKILPTYPSEPELSEILARMTGPSPPVAKPVLTKERVLAMQRLIREVILPDYVREYISRLVRLTHPNEDGAPPRVSRYVRLGASPRGAIALVLAAKVVAASDGRPNVSPEDVARVFYPALRHRLILSFEAEADGIAAESLLADVLDAAERLPRRVRGLDS